jgi:hypothetical protein
MSRFLFTIVQLSLYQTIYGCVKVLDLADVRTAVQLSDSRNILFCPFSVFLHERNDYDPIIIEKEGTRIICEKTTMYDKCAFYGNGRHIDIVANDVAIVGFEFIGSTNSAISINEATGTTFLDCVFRK